MSISSETRKSGPFLGTGAVSEYPFEFTVFRAEDLLLVVADEDGAERTLVLDSDYTVELNADQDSNPGGTVILADPLPSDHLLVTTSNIEALQPTDLTNQGGFYPAVVNDSLDRLTILIQQLREQVSRSLKVSITSSDEATPDALVSTINAAVLVATESADTAAAAAAAAALFDPANFVLKAGDTMTGALVVPAGGFGSQVAQAQEVANYGHRNKLLNGDFSQNVRALTSVADDTYFLDRWYILTETGNVTVAQLTDAESGAPFGVRLTQPDASPKRMGFAQIIESKNIRQFASTAMNLAAHLRMSVGGNIRYAVIEHTGTADVVTSDVVNNWASATFTPTNFFIAGVNIISTGTIAPGAATWGEVSDWDALGASVKNVIVFIWTESQVAQNVTLDCSRAQYEPGVIATPHDWRMNEGFLCRPYARLNSGGSGISSSATALLSVTVSFDDPMRGTPAASVFDGSVAILDPGIAFRTLSSISTSGVTANGGYLDLVSSGMTASRTHVLIPGKVLFTAEL